MPSLKKIRNYFLLIIFLLFILVTGALFYNGWKQSELILNPPRTAISEKDQHVADNPSDYGLVLHPFTVSSPDGGSFRACLIKAAPDTDSALAVRQDRLKKLLASRKIISPTFRGNSRGTIILSHNHGQKMEDMYRIAEYLTAAHFDCLVYDLRAHGERNELISTYGKEEVADIQALIREAARQFGDLGSISAYGEGMGAAITLQAAEATPSIRSVVSLDSFATLKETIWHRLVEDHGKLLSYIFYYTGDQILSWRAGFRSTDITPVASASRISVPAMIVCTEKESPFYSDAAQNIHTALASKEKVLYTPFPTENSTGLPDDTDELYALVTEWFAKHNHPPVPEVVVPVLRVPPSNPK